MCEGGVAVGGGGEAGEMGDAHRPELLFFNLLKSTGYYMGRGVVLITHLHLSAEVMKG